MHISEYRPCLATYFNLRAALGLIALTFPILLVIGGIITGGAVMPSISDYYFSPMRDLVVGALVAIGLFLINYQDARDSNRSYNMNARLSGLASIGLAIFPNQPHSEGIETFVHAVMNDQVSVALHFLCSFVFLTTLTVFCFVQFTRGLSNAQARLYRYCGWGLVIIGVSASFVSFVRSFDWFGAREFVETYNLIFWMETAGIWVFCIAWIAKGHTEQQSYMLNASLSNTQASWLRSHRII